MNLDKKLRAVGFLLWRYMVLYPVVKWLGIPHVGLGGQVPMSMLGCNVR